MKHYDVDVVFLYVKNANGGTVEARDAAMRSDISNFINFIYGRAKGNGSNEVKSGRLAIYNEYVGMGRKDIVVAEVSNELFYASDGDPDAVAKFKVKFTVYDPTTDVTPTYNGEHQCTNLNIV